jgi:hypothetical protein
VRPPERTPENSLGRRHCPIAARRSSSDSDAAAGSGTASISRRHGTGRGPPPPRHSDCAWSIERHGLTGEGSPGREGKRRMKTRDVLSLRARRPVAAAQRFRAFSVCVFGSFKKKILVSFLSLPSLWVEKKNLYQPSKIIEFPYYPYILSFVP